MDARLTVLVLAALVAGCTTAPSTPTVTPPASAAVLALEKVVDGLSRPLFYAPIPGSDDHLALEQGGLARVVRDGRAIDPSLLDVRDRLVSGGEQGLLGFAFAPDYPDSGVAYAAYTDRNGDDVLARYHLVDGVLGQEEILLTIEEPYVNHNGGGILFGPDGNLWFGVGDGGSGGDPHGNGQDKDALLGSMLRLHVESSGNYTIPEDNPFAHGGGAPEVKAKGLRNPWRFSFDRANGDLWIGDVGQNKREEIDHVPAGTPGLLNFGWNVYEGNDRYSTLAQPSSEVTMPVADYENGNGDCAVTGGYVYRGQAIPSLRGVYLFGDYCSGKIRAWDGRELSVRLDTGLRISSFGEDVDGELFVVDHGGAVYRLTSRSLS